MMTYHAAHELIEAYKAAVLAMDDYLSVYLSDADRLRAPSSRGLSAFPAYLVLSDRREAARRALSNALTGQVR